MRNAKKAPTLLLSFTLMFSAVNLVLAESASKRSNSMSIELSSSAFSTGQQIPKEFTADGKNQSPPLKWSSVPPGAKSLALICDDPDAPMGTWVHWVLYDLPASTHQLDQGVVPNGARQGTNSFHKIGYGGPAPPPGRTHRYFFKLFALDTTLNLDPGADAKKLEAAMHGHVLAEGQLIGQYAR
jgi:Raf kinase inhibitor-like YbhB/YbcL family protein